MSNKQGKKLHSIYFKYLIYGKSSAFDRKVFYDRVVLGPS